MDFDQDFLDQIDPEKSTFQMDVFFQAKHAKNVQRVNNIFLRRSQWLDVWLDWNCHEHIW